MKKINRLFLAGIGASTLFVIQTQSSTAHAADETVIAEIKKSEFRSDSGTVGPRFDVPETDVPETDVPGTDVPGTDVPGTDVPGTDVPGTDVPGTDVPGTDVPGTDIPGTDVPGTDVPGTDVPGTGVTENPTPSEPQIQNKPNTQSNQSKNIQKTSETSINQTAQTAPENQTETEVENADLLPKTSGNNGELLESFIFSICAASFIGAGIVLSNLKNRSKYQNEKRKW